MQWGGKSKGGPVAAGRFPHRILRSLPTILPSESLRPSRLYHTFEYASSIMLIPMPGISLLSLSHSVNDKIRNIKYSTE